MGFIFSYHAKDTNGEYKDGTIEAENQNDAIQKLKAKGLFIIKLVETEAEISPLELSPEEKREIEEEKVRFGEKGDSNFKKFECEAITREGVLIETIKAKDVEEAAAKITLKSIRIKTIIEKFPGEQKGVVFIQCPSCKKMMNIDATVCPYCGKTTAGISAPYIIGGLIFGAGGSVLFFYFTGMKDITASAICGLCGCNPIFWAFTLGGGLIGGIIGEIRKAKIKQQK